MLDIKSLVSVVLTLPSSRRRRSHCLTNWLRKALSKSLYMYSLKMLLKKMSVR